MLRDLQESTAHQPGFGTPKSGRLASTPTEPGAEGLTRFPVSSPFEWWHELPELGSARVRLRELRLSDAPALTAALGTPEVSEHLSPGPNSLTETEQFITWARRARAAGRYICFSVLPRNASEAAGVFQLWPLEPSFRTAEWGFALAHQHWGTGLFEDSARLVTRFAFERLGVLRLEARAAVDNVRGNRALRKMGAVPEGVLRKCFLANGEYRDHVMWSMLAEDWRRDQKRVDDGIRGAVA